MEATAYAKFQRFGRRKVGQVLDEIRGKSVRTAEAILPQVPRRASALVQKTLKSAVANLMVKAGKKLEPSQIWVKAAWSNQGPMKNLKRIQPGPMGRALPFKRKMCHLTVVVSDESRKVKGA
jgi:large subunit ribosomal protein L22